MPRRQEHEDQQDSAPVVSKPEEVAGVAVTDAPVENAVRSSDQVAEPARKLADPSDLTSAGPKQFADVGMAVVDAAAAAHHETAGGLPLSEIEAGDAIITQRSRQWSTNGSATRKGRRSRRRIEAVEVVPGAIPTTAPPAADFVDLDEEIRALRLQLVSRLRLQNAQLKTMLERFEP